MRNTALIPAALCVAALAACSAGSSSAPPAAKPAAASPAAKASSVGAAKAIAACRTRKAGGQLYVRDDDPGAQVLGQEIGGEWGWDYSTGKCQSALGFAVATAGQASGECTTVGYAADNPGWNPNAVPAAPLKDVAGEAGPGC